MYQMRKRSIWSQPGMPSDGKPLPHKLLHLLFLWWVRPLPLPSHPGWLRYGAACVRPRVYTVKVQCFTKPFLQWRQCPGDCLVPHVWLAYLDQTISEVDRVGICLIRDNCKKNRRVYVCLKLSKEDICCVQQQSKQSAVVTSIPPLSKAVGPFEDFWIRLFLSSLWPQLHTLLFLILQRLSLVILRWFVCFELRVCQWDMWWVDYQ